MTLPVGLHIDPLDPRAPSEAVWAGLTEAERDAVVAALPSEVPDHVLAPAGDWHSEARASAQDVLRRYFGRIGRRVYVSGELNIYYPSEPIFAPDLLAVVDVGVHKRRSWVVSKEGKGLDFALEIHDAGRRSKDLVRNVAWYARLGIREYFVFDVTRAEIVAHRLPRESRTYDRILPQGGRFLSDVLEVDFLVEDKQLRVAARAASVMLDAPALLPKLEAYLDEALERAAVAERERAAEQEAREAAEKARAEAEAELATLRARLADLEKK